MNATICDRIAIGSVLAVAFVTVGCWVYALAAERRAEHLYLPPLVSLDPSFAAADDGDAQESVASSSGVTGDIRH